MIEHDYVAKYEDTISVSFYASDPKLSPIGKKMEKCREVALDEKTLSDDTIN